MNLATKYPLYALPSGIIPFAIFFLNEYIGHTNREASGTGEATRRKKHQVIKRK